MSSTTELIVEGYTQLEDRRSLEGLRTHRRRLAADLKSIKGAIAETRSQIERT